MLAVLVLVGFFIFSLDASSSTLNSSIVLRLEETSLEINKLRRTDALLQSMDGGASPLPSERFRSAECETGVKALPKAQVLSTTRNVREATRHMTLQPIIFSMMLREAASWENLLPTTMGRDPGISQWIAANTLNKAVTTEQAGLEL